MPSGLIARKIGMSQIFTEHGESVPVTYLRIEPNHVIRTKTKEKDGYEAVVLGIEPKAWKTRKGNEHTRFRAQKEWKVESLEGLEPGKQMTVESMPIETMVTVTGTSKGKGFQGVMKRHHFGGGPASHGSHFHREPGSIGMREHPGRIHKGKRMAGHMGNETVTIRHRPVVVSDTAKGILAIKGAIPGPTGGIVYLTVEPTAA